MSTKIAVIESRWGGNNSRPGLGKNITVRPLFDFLSSVYTGGINGYDYNMVPTVDAFTRTLETVAKSNATTMAYIAMHGNEKHLWLPGGEKISPTILINTLERIEKEPRSKLRGLLFGACRFCTPKLAERIFAKCGSITWIAGYQSNADFVSSTALDLLFFDLLIKVKNKLSGSHEDQIIKEVARVLRESVPGLCITSPDANVGEPNLSFSIFISDRRAKTVKNILEIESNNNDRKIGASKL